MSVHYSDRVQQKGRKEINQWPALGLVNLLAFTSSSAKTAIGDGKKGREMSWMAFNGDSMARNVFNTHYGGAIAP